MFWAVVGLVLESCAQEDKERIVISELAKRVLQKVDFPLLNDKLDTEFKNLCVTVCESANDHHGILDALNLKAKMDPSDHAIKYIISNYHLNNFEAVKSSCISLLESSSFVDSSIWLSFLNVLDKIDNGTTVAKQLLESFEAKGDKRGTKIAALELKIAHPQAYNKSLSDILFDYTVELRQKPSTFNDVVYFTKKLCSEGMSSFYMKVADYINSVFFSSNELSFTFFRLNRLMKLLKNRCISTYTVTWLQFRPLNFLSMIKSRFY